jgi:hypothetical protein
MTRDQELFMSTQFEEFLRDIRSVRELIQCGGHVLITDLNMIGRHADTLEVLAVTRKPSCYERSPFVAEDEDITALFNSLTRAILVRYFTGHSVDDTHIYLFRAH